VHLAHQNQWKADKADSGENDAACSKAVDECAGQHAAGKSQKKKAQQKALCYLASRKSQAGRERRVEDREAIKNHANRKEEIQEGGHHDPPSVENTGRSSGAAGWSFLNCLRGGHHRKSNSPHPWV
jgi:hypothetical protein